MKKLLSHSTYKFYVRSLTIRMVKAIKFEYY